MTDQHEVTRSERSSRNWLKFTSWASVIYVIGVVFIFKLVLKPADAMCVGDYFPCLDANQIGDVLAGVFAPLAFLWLVAAVLVQSQELRAQREELEMTREEMRLQRDEFVQSREVAIESKGVAEAQAKAADAQAAAAQRNVAAANIQNKILKEQLEAQRAELRRQGFSSLLDQLLTALLGRVNQRVTIGAPEDFDSYILYKKTENLASDRDGVLAELVENIIENVVPRWENIKNPGENEISESDLESVVHVRNIVHALVAVEPEAGLSQQILFQTIRGKELKKLMDHLVGNAKVAA